MDEIKTEKAVYTPTDFVLWQENEMLEISPKFQRRSVWKRPARSFFIDTLLRGMTVPPLYLRLTQNKQKSKIVRCQHHIRSGVPGYPALQETVISSNVASLVHLAAIRHRIVHDQNDAKVNFDTASLGIAGRAYPASRPGKLLRDRDRSVPPRRWLDVIIDELVNLAAQMV